MATAPFDAELMTQQVAATSLPKSDWFSTVRDEHGGLMMFGLSQSGMFYVLKDDANGSRVLVDLGAVLGLPNGSVTVFATTQHHINSTVYLVAATTTTTADGGRQTELIVLKPFAPSAIDVNQPTPKLDLSVIPNVGANPTSVAWIYFVSARLFLLPLRGLGT